jgi:hypothetical protein
LIADDSTPPPKKSFYRGGKSWCPRCRDAARVHSAIARVRTIPRCSNWKSIFGLYEFSTGHPAEAALRSAALLQAVSAGGGTSAWLPSNDRILHRSPLCSGPKCGPGVRTSSTSTSGVTDLSLSRTPRQSIAACAPPDSVSASQEEIVRNTNSLIKTALGVRTNRLRKWTPDRPGLPGARPVGLVIPRVW